MSAVNNQCGVLVKIFLPGQNLIGPLSVPGPSSCQEEKRNQSNQTAICLQDLSASLNWLSKLPNKISAWYWLVGGGALAAGCVPKWSRWNSPKQLLVGYCIDDPQKCPARAARCCCCSSSHSNSSATTAGCQPNHRAPSSAAIIITWPGPARLPDARQQLQQWTQLQGTLRLLASLQFSRTACLESIWGRNLQSISSAHVHERWSHISLF